MTGLEPLPDIDEFKLIGSPEQTITSGPVDIFRSKTWTLTLLCIWQPPTDAVTVYGPDIDVEELSIVVGVAKELVYPLGPVQE